MAHQSQMIFCSTVKALFPSYFKNKRVLDIGSLDVNGCNYPLFDKCSYMGVDLSEGPNVDVVCSGHELGAPDNHYDVIISTECGEHDKHWKETIKNAMRMLKHGGLFIYTCATTGRPEHGTTRTDTFSSPFTTDYYNNLTEEDIRSVFGFNLSWSYCKFSVDEVNHDLRFYGFKRGIPPRFSPSILTLIRTHLKFFYKKRIKDIRNWIQKHTVV